jgi:hypothetical protein
VVGERHRRDLGDIDAFARNIAETLVEGHSRLAGWSGSCRVVQGPDCEPDQHIDTLDRMMARRVRVSTRLVGHTIGAIRKWPASGRPHENLGARPGLCFEGGGRFARR